MAIPADGRLLAYKVQAISRYAPHPAAARLWEEYLFSAEGQNLRLKGHAWPAELSAMTAAHTVDASLAAKLPTVPGGPPPPPGAQQTVDQMNALTDNWSRMVGS